MTLEYFFWSLGESLKVCVFGFVFGSGAGLGSVWLGFGALSMLSKRTLNVVVSDC